MKRTLLYAFFLMTCLVDAATPLAAQSDSFRAAPVVRLPKDSTVRSLLLSSLEGFLAQKEEPNRHNRYVWQPELPATSALLDEMKGIGYDDSLKDKDFFRPRLTNCTLLKDSIYLLQLSYDGIVNGIPVHKAAFRLLARRDKDRFCFYAPLKRNTTGWKSKREGNVVFHYKDSLHIPEARSYAHYNDLYLKKLNKPEQQTQFYCCDDFQEALQLTGIDYKSAYSGVRANSLSAYERDTGVVINGYFASDFRNFDPHDMWHEKLRTVMSSEKINRPVDEGCAYLYGGSWGLSWEEIKALFKAYAREHPEADWLRLYLDGNDFKEGQEPLKIAYFINALLVQQLEKEKGFSAVMTLLSCGKKEKEDGNYFKALEQLTGITKENFNTNIRSLVAAL